MRRGLVAALLCALILDTGVDVEAQTGLVPFSRGDANSDGRLNLADGLYVLNFVFRGGPEPSCRKAGDADDGGSINIADPIYLMNFVFRGGPAPLPPFEICGADETPDSLSCDSFPPCDEFETLLASYSTLSTLAGSGLVRENNFNGWLPSFESGPAIDAELSRPHMAMADDAGNLYIADKNAHAIRKVTLDGTITTIAGTGIAGDDGDEPGAGTERRLANPNGLWVRADGTVYILDLDNDKIRRLAPDGTLTTLIATPIAVGRGLWVSDDESLAYIANGNQVKRWTPQRGVDIFAQGFSSLGNLVVDPDGHLVVTDRAANSVYRIRDVQQIEPLAGDFSESNGGDGHPALETGFHGVRGVWFLSSGGYFLATHEGSQIWYIDTSGIAHVFLEGEGNHCHQGDGEPFRSPGCKISEPRAVTLDRDENIIITENDFGFVRMIERVPPSSDYAF